MSRVYSQQTISDRQNLENEAISIEFPPIALQATPLSCLLREISSFHTLELIRALRASEFVYSTRREISKLDQRLCRLIRVSWLFLDTLKVKDGYATDVRSDIRRRADLHNRTSTSWIASQVLVK